MQSHARRIRRLNLKPGPIRITADGHQDLSHLYDDTVRPVSGRAGYVEPVPKPLQGKGQLEVWGEVFVKNGDTEFRARNKIVGQGLRHLCTSSQGHDVGNNVNNRMFATNDMGNSYIRVGTGTGATLETTTALFSQIATSPSSTLQAFDNPVAGTYRNKFTATWNSGTLPASTITEIGVFARMTSTTLGSYWGANGQNVTSLALFARLASADGEFTSFTINTAVPLTIEYRIVFTFT